MPSYFLDRRVRPDGRTILHEHGRCPPACFSAGGAGEYLGDLLDAPQALLLARLKYPLAHGCPFCAEAAHEASAMSYVSSSPPAPILRAA